MEDKLKVVILIGPPASGKSTYAKKLVKEQQFFRVNKDELRLMLHGKQFDHRHEMMISSVHGGVLHSLITLFHNIVVDSTNLSTNHRVLLLCEILASMKGRVSRQCYEISFVDHFCDLSFDELCARDRRREASVGPAVLEKMWAKVEEYRKSGNVAEDLREAERLVYGDGRPGPN